MSVSNLDSQSGTGLSIASEATVATYTTAADGWVSGRLLLSNLNAAAAVVTVKVQLLDGSNNKLGVPVSFSVTKDATSDTTFGATWGPVRVTSGQKLRVRAASSNASDTNASWASVMDDADVASAGVNVTKWSGTNVATPDTAGYPKVTVKSGTGTGEISLSSGQVTATNGGASVTVIPLSSTVSTGEVTTNDITAYLGTAPDFTWAIVDQNREPVPLTGKTLLFTANPEGTPANPDISASGSASGDDNNQVTVSLTTSDTGEVQTLLYSLWNVTDNLLLARGRLLIKTATQQS
jgi:hypothetical protein